ncbi:MAG: RNA polymerase sigma factor [Bacteroidetes bacterium]|nr:RNA polymerase sigma factor [Bacteroidota bacterium]
MQLFNPSYSSFSDEKLMLALSKGDKRAFDELYDRYAKALKGYFMRMLWKNESKSEDFVHDLFVKIIHNPESFDSNRSFKTWLYSVACNMCKNEYKKQEVRKGTSTGIDQFYSISDKGVDVLNEVQMSHFGSQFEKYLAELKTEHQEVFSLRHMDDLSIKEIAEVLEINEGTVKSRLFYATKQLADKLKEFNTVNT